MGITNINCGKKEWESLKKLYDYLKENYPEFRQIISKEGKCILEYKPENVCSFYDVMALEGKNWESSIFNTIFEEDFSRMEDDYASKTSAMKEMKILYPVYTLGTSTVLRKDEIREFFSEYPQDITVIDLNRVLIYDYSIVKNIASLKMVEKSECTEVNTLEVYVVNYQEVHSDLDLYVPREENKYWSQELKFSNSASNMLKTIVNCLRLVDSHTVIHIYQDGENPSVSTYGAYSSSYKYGDNVTVDKFMRDLIYYIKTHCNKPIKELYVLGKEYTKFRVRKNFDEEYTMTIY